MEKYLHMIASTHMLNYMICWSDLTKYSQQGWEALNVLIKLFFFRITNKGGDNSGGKAGSKIIGDLVQRRFFWICNLVPETLWDKTYQVSKLNSEDEEKCADNDADDDVILDRELEELELVW